MRHTARTRFLICSLIITTGCLFGGVELHVRDGRPMVDGVYVNGHGPYRFLVDTGANINLIENEIAKKIGMNATFHVDLASAAGKTASSGSDGNKVVLGSVEADEQKFLFSGLNAIHNSSPDVQGVLGQWFLARFDYTLDLRSKRIEFGRQDRNGTRSSFKMINARPVVSTSLGGLVLDSGSVDLVLFRADLDGGSTVDAELRTLAGSRRIRVMSGQQLIIEGRKVWRGDALAMSTRPELGVAGLLPVSLFKAIYVCNSEGYVVLQ